MANMLTTDICVIGAGSGGLSVAAGAAMLGAPTILVEKHKMGGDCLNYGCVPSKALIAAGHHAKTIKDGEKFGIRPAEPEIDFQAVHDHIQGVIAHIAPTDSVERFEGLGVKVIQDEARFIGPDKLQAGDTVIKARRFVIATGSRAAAPPIPGLDETYYLTNESIFDLTTCPNHLIIVGGGPIGCELAQAYRRLGAKVTIISQAFLEKDDPELAQIVTDRLTEDGVTLLTVETITKTEGKAGHISVSYKIDGADKFIEGSHLLVATGRAPNVTNLGLDDAGVEYDKRGIKTDSHMRTSNRRIYAVGDCTGGLQFTHMSGYQAGIIIRNILFRLPSKVTNKAAPWVTYTDPELAHVGLNERDATGKGLDIRILRWSMAENDRAQAEHETTGLIKVITSSRGKILGASIVAAGAGEIIQPWVLAINEGLKISSMASYIAPYPTRSEISKRAAGSFYTKSLFSPKIRKLVRFLSKFG